jgi:hypothetical protein
MLAFSLMLEKLLLEQKMIRLIEASVIRFTNRPRFTVLP